MAGGDSQTQNALQILIRETNPKNSKEIRVARLKRRIEKLRSELDDGNVEVEEAKLCGEALEQDLKGYEVELALQHAATQVLEEISGEDNL